MLGMLSGDRHVVILLFCLVNNISVGVRSVYLGGGGGGSNHHNIVMISFGFNYLKIKKKGRKME